MKKDEIRHFDGVIHEFSWVINIVLFLRCFIEVLLQKILAVTNFYLTHK